MVFVQQVVISAGTTIYEFPLSIFEGGVASALVGYAVAKLFFVMALVFSSRRRKRFIIPATITMRTLRIEISRRRRRRRQRKRSS